MPVRKYKPTSPGRRFMSTAGFEEITTSKPERSLLEPLKNNAGRNNQGKITVRHRGGGRRRTAPPGRSPPRGTTAATTPPPASPRPLPPGRTPPSPPHRKHPRTTSRRLTTKTHA